MGQQDLSYRSLFSYPRMVEELVRGFVEEPWVEKLDFTTLKRVNASYVSVGLKGREGDLLWKLRLHDGSPVYVYLLIEHQSRVDLKNPELQALEQGTRRLAPLLRNPEDAPLRRTLLVWIFRVLMPRHGEDVRVPENLSLEDFETMLAKRVEEWNRELREEGRLAGLKEGRQKGEAELLLRQLTLKFGPLDIQTRERVRSADADNLLTWGERVLTAERLEDVFGS